MQSNTILTDQSNDTLLSNVQFACCLRASKVSNGHTDKDIQKPLITHEKDSNIVVVNGKQKKKTVFEFDRVHSGELSVTEIYQQTISEYFEYAMLGTSSCIFTFGPLK